MEVIERFNKIIKEEYEKYKEVKTMSYEEFFDEYYLWDYNCTLEFKNKKTGKILKKCSDFEENINEENFDVENPEEWEFIVYISPLKYADEIVDDLYTFLKNVNYTYEEMEDLLDVLADYFYDANEFLKDEEEIDEDLEAVLEYIDFIDNVSLKELIIEFNDNEEFAKLLISEYCEYKINYLDELSEIDEKIKESFAESTIISTQTINDYARNKLLSIVDELTAVGYSEENIVKLLNYYFKYPNIPLASFSKILGNKIYSKEDDEIFLKNYMQVVIVYDFYISANGSKYFSDLESADLKYIKFIEKYPLDKIIQQFKEDESFRTNAIEHFELLNMFERKNDTDLNEEIKEKFNLVYKLEK